MFGAKERGGAGEWWEGEGEGEGEGAERIGRGQDGEDGKEEGGGGR